MTSFVPRIGVRPVIDGRRRGVRESLEEQTMAMARRTAALLSAKLRHPSGEAVECAIADTTIAGMAEAAACDAKFAGANVGATVSGDAVLVLRQRDHRHGPAAAQSDLGI